MQYDHFDSGFIGTLTLVADEMGLRRIDFETARFPTCIQEDWRKDPSFFDETKKQLRAFFEGELTCFDLPLAPQGTDFQLKVWRALETIPYGQTKSYRWVAEQIGNPKAVRAVGGANGRNPLPLVIPCHRVIGRDGSLTGFGGGLDIKARLIEMEQKNDRRLKGVEPNLVAEILEEGTNGL